MVHVARSARKGPCAEWHVSQRVWPLAAWRPLRVGRAWQVTHAGGDATPFGPWARWHVVQPCAACLTAGALPDALFAWHVVHCAFLAPVWES